MTTIVKRITKGSTLTVAEMDANVNNLNNTKLETTGGTLTGLPVLANQDVDIISPVYPTTKPSLNLDFTRGQLDPRITFARNSGAAYYDGKSVAKAEENLLLQSQAFGTTPWVVTGTSITTTETAPDGTATASLWTLLNQYNSIRTPIANISGLIVGATYTVSLWVKNNIGTNVYTIWLDGAFISLGTITPTSTWTRYSFSFVYPASVTAFNILQDRNTSGFGSVYVWGAQLEQRSSVTAYTPTTTSAITNYIPVLKYAASGAPRFDYDPVTSKPLGLLIEEGRTNLVTYSQDFNTSTNWLLIRASKTANCIVAPDGTLTGTKLIGNTTANSSHWISDYANRTVYAGSSYTFSVYVKAGEYNYVAIFPNVSNATTLGYPTFFNLTTGAVSQVANTNASINVTFLTSSVNVGNGWWRISISSYALCTTTACHPAIAVLSAMPAASDGSDPNAQNGYSGVYIWGPQFEANGSSLAIRGNFVGTGSTTTNIVLDAGASSVDGTYVGNRLNISDDSNEIRNITAYVGATKTATISAAITTAPAAGVAYTIIPATMTPSGFPTSYIPTPTVAVSRPADAVSMTGTNFSSWFNIYQGSMYAEYDTFAQATGWIFTISESNGSANYISLVKGNTGYANRFVTVSTSVNQGNIDIGTISLNTIYKLIGAYYVNNNNFCVNGGSVSNDSTVTLPININSAYFGTYFTQSMNGHIRKLTYYPKALSSTELQALTS